MSSSFQKVRVRKMIATKKNFGCKQDLPFVPQDSCFSTPVRAMRAEACGVNQPVFCCLVLVGFGQRRASADLMQGGCVPEWEVSALQHSFYTSLSWAPELPSLIRSGHGVVMIPLLLALSDCTIPCAFLP